MLSFELDGSADGEHQRIADAAGGAIEGELWELLQAAVGPFVATLPTPHGAGPGAARGRFDRHRLPV
ncbi:hypothetical protein ACQP1P_35550 [Dactylosporangium sp. CA-052675]|uniref:hypothetical protein n=1 Tax=Dactylosporangium sp. CA-052675 TaxID=3239927 RepID=UPI003D8BED62